MSSMIGVPQADGETCAILYNKCHGGFEYSEAAIHEYNRITGSTANSYSYISRNDPVMLALFEKQGSKWMSGAYARLERAVFPLKFRYALQLHEYDGRESISVDYKQFVLHEITRLVAGDGPSVVEEIRALLHQYAGELMSFNDQMMQLARGMSLPHV